MRILALTICIITILSSTAALSAELKSSHGDWNVYSDGKDSCYIASVPVSEDGNFKKRGQPYVLISSKGKEADEINVSSGYPYKKGVDVELAVDSSKYTLFSEGEHAWAKRQNADKAIVYAMKKGSKLKIKGVSAKGSYSLDTYSLKGISAAYDAMKKACK